MTIKIFERFDNADFKLESIEFLMPNEALQFKEARVRVTTILEGSRYLMQTWFFSTALVCILASTFVMTLITVISVVYFKRVYKLSWL